MKKILLATALSSTLAFGFFNPFEIYSDIKSCEDGRNDNRYVDWCKDKNGKVQLSIRETNEEQRELKKLSAKERRKYFLLKEELRLWYVDDKIMESMNPRQRENYLDEMVEKSEYAEDYGKGSKFEKRRVRHNRHSYYQYKDVIVKDGRVSFVGR